MPAKRTRLKPLARALRSRVLAGRGSSSLSRELEAELFLHAQVLSEGSVRALPRGHDSYFGSTMISVPLSHVSALVRGDLGEVQRAELLSAASGSVRLRLRAMRLACAEVARRVPDRALGTAQVETRVRITHEQLHIDVDLEVPLGVSFGAKRR